MFHSRIHADITLITLLRQIRVPIQKTTFLESFSTLGKWTSLLSVIATSRIITAAQLSELVVG